MNELNDFLKILAAGKKEKAEKVAEATQQLGDFLGIVAEAKAADPKHQMMKEVKKNLQHDIGSLFEQLQQSVPVHEEKIDKLVETVQLVNEIESNVVGEFVVEDGKFLDPTTLTEVVVPEIKPAAEVYTKAEIDELLKQNASFQQPDPKKVDPNFKAIQDKLKFLEQSIGKIAATGPGSGEVNLRWLDDVDRSSIGDNKYLRYNDTKKKFDFTTLSGGGAPQVQSDWNQIDDTEPSFIRNKPTIPTSFDRLVSADGSDQAVLGNDGVLTVPGNVIPPVSGLFTLGDATHKWADIWIGPNTLNIEDQITGNNAQLTIQDGTLFIDNTQRIQIGQMALTTNGISLVAGGTDQNIIIGELLDTGYTELKNVGIQFKDGTQQTTAAVAQIQSDWTQADNTKLDFIKNKPTLFSGSYTDLTNKPTIPDTLDDLGDTNVAGVSNNQVLTWNTATSKWIPTTVNGVDTLPTGIAYYGSFYDISATQTALSTTTAYVVNIGQTAESNGVTITNGNRITFAYAGTYEIEFSIQFHNVETDASDVNVWFRRNGADIPDSNSRFTIPSKQNNNGYLIAVTPYIVTVAAGEYVQLVWSCNDNTTTKIETLNAQTTPTVPRTPGVIVLVNPVTSLITPTTVESLTVVGDISTGTISFPDNTEQSTAWLGTYSYDDLTDKPSIPSLTGYATESYVTTAISNVIGAAPDALNTLKEIADQLASDESAVASLTTAVAGKVSLTGSYANPSWITSLAYGKLTGAPTNVSAFTNDSGYLSSVSWSQVTGKPDAILTLNDTNVVSNAMLVNKSITIGSTAVELGASITTLTGLTGVTSNAATAFIAGAAAESGVALQMPREGALRNMTNGANTMYFDVSNGGTTHGNFNFRSSSNFTSLLHLSSVKATINPAMEVNAQTPYVGRTSFNAALDTVVTVDNLKYRISNQGGVFPQIASASGSPVDVCYDVEGIINGTTNPTYANNTGYLLAANGTWLSIYSSHGMDARSDRLTAHITDKAAGKIYRVTFIKTNNNSNTDGYNIIVERIL